ncbi:MAG: BamA/TamA family outer membrane protein [Desulfobacterales bacterium]|nr:BamA/TamA family outer membrane protein [Desulfobacterales bacterium]
MKNSRLRIKSSVICCFLILFIFSAPAGGLERSRPFRLNGVKLTGVTSAFKKNLLITLASRAPSFWKFWHPKAVVSEDDLKDDILRIIQFYKNHGYYHAAATYKTETLSGLFNETAPDEKTDSHPTGPPVPVRVTFRVTEGHPVLIRAINFTIEPGDETGTITEKQLLGAIPLQPGQIFNVEKYRDSKKNIQQVLGNNGFPFARLSGKVTIDTVANAADVSYTLTSGHQYTFGAIRILENDAHVKEIVVRRALEFKTGQTYSSESVDQSQRNLFNMDIFRLSAIKPEAPGPGAKSVDMAVVLKAKKTQSIKAGIGYGTEDRFRVKAAWTYRNLLGRGGRVSLSAKRSDLIENIQIDYLQPYFLNAKSALSSKGGFEREKLTSYTNRTIFSGIALTQDFKKHWLWANSYNLELNNPENVKVTSPEEIQKIFSENTYLFSSIQTGLIYDSTRNALDPSEGTILSLSIQWADSVIGSEIDLIKPAIEIKKYMPLAGMFVLAGRLRLEAIESHDSDQIPIFKRLFLGGGNTVRGYGYQELPPLDETGVPLGGLSALNASIEMRHPVYHKVSGVVFGDLGLLNTKTFNYNFSEIRYSAGVGLRYDTVLGPVRLDWGYKLNPGDEEKGKDRWRIHLNIGQAF